MAAILDFKMADMFELINIGLSVFYAPENVVVDTIISFICQFLTEL